MFGSRTRADTVQYKLVTFWARKQRKTQRMTVVCVSNEPGSQHEGATTGQIRDNWASK